MGLTDRIEEARAVIAAASPAGIERRTVSVADGGDYRGGLQAVELRETEGDESLYTLSGRAAVFDDLSVDLGGFRERIKRGAFKRVLGDDVRFLVNHDPNLLLGRTRSGTLRLKESPKGLEYEVDAAPVSIAYDLRVWVERGDMTQNSFAFRVAEDEWDEEDGELIRTVHRFAALFDASAVTFPAYPTAEIDGVRALPEDRDGLLALAWAIHRGDKEADQATRDAIAEALHAHSTITPWAAERTFRAAQEEPEFLAAAHDLRVSIAPHTDDGAGRAARGRRLRQREQQLAV